jgi:hypothetical protein
MAPIELPPLPDDFEATRNSLHRLAEDVIKVAREHVTGEFPLAQTPAGFGTPEWGGGNQIRVEGTELVVVREGGESRAPITTLAAATEQIGPDWLPHGLELSNERLPLNPAAAAALAAAYAVGQAALARIRDAAAPGDRPTEPTLWPEHFDLAIEMGDEEAGLRANYGLSPGDGDQPEPYFYVGPWSAEPEGELWNASGFNGAELGYEQMAAAADPAVAVIEFSLERKDALAGQPPQTRPR